ncbi:MAG: trypsin-like peptidase domain-containing protein [Sphingosinicella sp.]|nr:trypsin-like peptidase domain-containing protein [Sphingosinicella sp.]
MIPIDKLECVVRFDAGQGTGSAFTLEVDNKQYLITARHLVGETKNPTEIRLWLFDRWHEIEVKLVGTGTDQFPPESDFAVFACQERITTFSQTATRGSFYLSQDVYFLGYPYNNMTDGLWSPNLAFPLVKKAIVSGVMKTSIKPGLLVLDGHNNPGFSGGPVLAQSPEDQQIRVIGIVSGYKTDLMPIDGKDELWVEVNAGIIYATPMAQILDAIEINPIGHPIEAGWIGPLQGLLGEPRIEHNVGQVDP